MLVYKRDERWIKDTGICNQELGCPVLLIPNSQLLKTHLYLTNDN